MTDLDQLFRSHPFIATLSDDHITTLESCGAALLTFEPGDKIMTEGGKADTCFFIDDGDVALEMYVGGGKSRTVQTVHGGDIVGWSWLIPPYQRAFDATALTHVTALRVDAVLLRETMERDKAFGYEMMKRFCDVIVSRLDASRIRLIDMYGPGDVDLRTRSLRAKGRRSLAQ